MTDDSQVPRGRGEVSDALTAIQTAAATADAQADRCGNQRRRDRAKGSGSARKDSSVMEQPVGIGSHKVAHRSRDLAEFPRETESKVRRRGQRFVRSDFVLPEPASRRLRTFRVCCRHPKHSSTFCRKPSSNDVVTQALVFSHHEQEADSCHAVRVTFMEDLSLAGNGDTRRTKRRRGDERICQRPGKVRAAEKGVTTSAGVAEFAIHSRRFGSPGCFTIVKRGVCQGQTPDVYATKPTDRSSRSRRCS